MSTLELHPFSWERVDRAVEIVHDRRRRTVAALEAGNVPYAIIGGNAVAAWVARVNEAAVRNTRDVDILIQRSDLPSAIEAMEKAGFVYRHVARVDMFLDGPDAKAQDAVHVIFTGEKVRPEYVLPNPEINETTESDIGRVVNLDALVRMKLTSNRRKDQVHIDDLVMVGLVDSTWLQRIPPELTDRLKYILDNPEE